jgi:hypothetical protein
LMAPLAALTSCRHPIRASKERGRSPPVSEAGGPFLGDGQKAVEASIPELIVYVAFAMPFAVALLGTWVVFRRDAP